MKSIQASTSFSDSSRIKSFYVCVCPSSHLERGINFPPSAQSGEVLSIWCATSKPFRLLLPDVGIKTVSYRIVVGGFSIMGVPQKRGDNL